MFTMEIPLLISQHLYIETVPKFYLIQSGVSCMAVDGRFVVTQVNGKDL